MTDTFAGPTPLDPDRRRPPPPFPGFAELPVDIALEVCWVCRCVVPATDSARDHHKAWHRAWHQAFPTMISLPSGSDRVAPPGPLFDPDLLSGGLRASPAAAHGDVGTVASPPDPTSGEMGSTLPSRASASTVGPPSVSPDPTPEAGEREPAVFSTVGSRDRRHDPASGSYAPTPPPGDQGRGGVEAPTRGSETAGPPPTDSTLPSVARELGPPGSRAAERSRPGKQRSGSTTSAPGREPRPHPRDLPPRTPEQREREEAAAYEAWLAQGGRS